ncbi:plasmid stabilization protein [Flavobacterium akiainvivens]|uniref:Plasmid stabilization protein n=1 Tax=Flavobacterium akiainvivens TaxID=1202724 RepID=A0A0M9VGP0_9FLAO|nr:type II toxin-antitoxin system RelE/ParE family toxin [Flavobacterium akiainvivens]KOS04690.1 plasmid stabilization protein [Flavobacterium akiainvivens]SFQ64980.1 Plasmid stabilization system protein ParE [Flavobacterium akiainvivens]
MGLTVYWTQFAENKLEDIYTYYKYKAGKRVAAKLVDELVDASINLDQSPYIGQREEFLSDRLQEFRYIVHKNYKIIYWIDIPNQMLLISNVFDSRQNPDKIKRTP